jgi:phosphohistidine phosphatase
MEIFEIYMIRHGLAGEQGTYDNDNERPLTDEGHRKTKQVAMRLDALELQFDLILTSPLIRAKQTAEILQMMGLSKHLEESPFLAPNGDFEGWLGWLEQWQQDGKCLALVGHEPALSEWTEKLIWGEARQRLILKKAGAIGIVLPTTGSPVGQSQLFWLAPPRLML